MSHSPSPPGETPGSPIAPPNEPKLESWGEIAAYLRRDIRTVQRWEKEVGLPVRRLVIGKTGQVYAYRSELDRWVLQRQPKAELEPSDRGSGVPEPTVPDRNPDKPGENPSPTALRPWTPVLLLLLLAAAAVYFYLHQRPKAPAAQPVATRVLLFVRPFTSTPGEKEFVQGLTYELITQLGRVSPGSIGVFAPTTSEELGAKSIQELKQSLKADFVLEGSVRRANEVIRIDIDLVSTADQTPTWTNSYTGNMRKVLGFQEQVATDVANHLIGALPQLTPQITAENGSHRNLAAAEKNPLDPQVSEAYLAGRVYLLDRDFPRSMDAFQRALQKDPNYAPAMAGLAISILLLGEAPNDAIPPLQALPQAKQYAQRALDQDPALSDAYCVLANFAQGYDHNLMEADRLYKKAIELDPRNVTALKWYSDYLFVSNRLAAASKQIDAALQLDPASPLLNTAKAEVKYYARDFDATLAQAQRTVDQYPEFILARFWLASAYRQEKMYAQAIDQFDGLRKRYPGNAALLMAYGHTLGVSGDRAGAQKVLNDLLSQSRSRYIPSVYIAGLYTSLGQIDEAFEWLDKAYAEKSDRLVYLGVDPIADTLRADPRFSALMRQVGLP